LTGLAQTYRECAAALGIEPIDALNGFLRTLEADAATTQSELRLVLGQPGISSQMIDNINASIHVRALLTDVFIVDEILRCWPDARFIYLLRHPAAIARSRQNARPQDSAERNAEMVRRYAQALENAREEHPGIAVRYEDLTAEPERVTRELCEFLGVEWEPAMLEYGEMSHGRYKAGLGDWSEKIKSGRIQAAAPLPSADEIPDKLRPIAAAWDYAPSKALHEPSPQE